METKMQAIDRADRATRRVRQLEMEVSAERDAKKRIEQKAAVEADKAKALEEKNVQQAERLRISDENAGRLSNRLRHITASDDRVSVSYIVTRSGKVLSEGLIYVEASESAHVTSTGDGRVTSRREAGTSNVPLC